MNHLIIILVKVKHLCEFYIVFFVYLASLLSQAHAFPWSVSIQQSLSNNKTPSPLMGSLYHSCLTNHLARNIPVPHPQSPKRTPYLNQYGIQPICGNNHCTSHFSINSAVSHLATKILEFHSWVYANQISRCCPELRLCSH